MTTFGQEVKDKIEFPDEEISQLRYNLIKEELEEFAQAVLNKDMVEVADALIDLQYVLDGAFLAFGLHSIKGELFNEVQRSNMSKLDADGKVIRREDGKVLKSNLYSPPDLKTIVNKQIENEK